MVPRLDPAFLNIPIAHRGLHDAALGVVENSLSAFEAAIEHGYGIELDVQLSADGEAMTFHDDTLDRLTNQRGPVKARSSRDLGSIPLNAGQDKIPNMAQTLGLIAGQVPLLVEIKDQDGALGTDVGPLEKRLAELLGSYDGPLGVMSFNPHSIAAFRKFAPHIPTGRVTCAFDTWPGVSTTDLAKLHEISAADAGGISFVSHNHKDLASDQITAAKSEGLDILCWTIKNLDQENQARVVAQNITFESYQAAHPAAH